MNTPDDSNKINAAIFTVADELGARAETLAWMLGGINSLCETRPDADITAREICAALIRDLNQFWTGRIEEGLDFVRIESGEEVGRLAFGLVAKGLLRVSANDRPEDFARIFTKDSLDGFLKSEGIVRRRVDFENVKARVARTLYVAGFAIVVASYGRLVSTKIAWIGWAVGMAGFALHYVKLPEPKRF